MILLPRFTVAGVIAQLPRASVYLGEPAHYAGLLAQNDFSASACRDTRLFVALAGPLPVAVFEQYLLRTRCTILDAYLMTEAGLICANAWRGRRVAGSVGGALAGTQLRVVGAAGQACETGFDGRIEIKGPGLFSGYWGDPEKSRAVLTDDGFFKTGDVGHIGAPHADTEGCLVLTGRVTDLIMSDGHEIHPRAIETLIDSVDGVAESAVIGVPHPVRGEAILAIVVPQAGVVPSEAAIFALLEASLAVHQWPTQIHFLTELPRNAAGMVRKNVLRQRFAS